MEKSMTGSDFIIDLFMYYKCHKISFKRGESYIDSPDWLKCQKAAINPINEKYNERFQ